MTNPLYANLSEDELYRIHQCCGDDVEVRHTYLAFTTWMVYHEAIIHRGIHLNHLIEVDLMDDYGCCYTGLKVMAFSELEDVQCLNNGAVNASFYHFNEETAQYEAFDPGFPSSHPNIKEQVKQICEKPAFQNQVKQIITNENYKALNESIQKPSVN